MDEMGVIMETGTLQRDLLEKMIEGKKSLHRRI